MRLIQLMIAIRMYFCGLSKSLRASGRDTRWESWSISWGGAGLMVKANTRLNAVRSAFGLGPRRKGKIGAAVERAPYQV